MRKLLIVLLLHLGFCVSCGAQQTPGSVLCGNTVNLTACPNPAVAIVIMPLNPSVAARGQITLRATWQLRDGTLSSIANPQCVWSSSDTTLATMNGPIATGVAIGTPTITAACGTTLDGLPYLTGTTALTVLGVPLITAPASFGCASPCPITPNGVNGVPYTFPFAASAGTPPYTWSVSVGSLPSGMALDSVGCGTAVNCRMTGTHNATDTTLFTIKVTDSLGAFSTLAVSWTTTAASCTPPNYCSRSDNVIVPGPSLPPAGLLGLVGANNFVFSDLNPGLDYLVRVTDYPMAQANLPQSTCQWSPPSSSTQRNWNSDTTFFAANDTCGGTDFFSYTAGAPGNPPTTAYRGRAVADVNGIKFSDFDFSTTNRLLFYSAGSTGLGTRATINSDLQDGTTGANSWTAAHITASVIQDATNCPGLTSYMTGPLGVTWNQFIAANLADVGTSVGATPVVAAGHRMAQDVGGLIILNDPVNGGCRWLDMKTGQVGGSWGPIGATTGWGPLPAPTAPVLAQLSGGTLQCGATYAVHTTYTVIGNNSSYGGQSMASPISFQTIGNVCNLRTIQVTPPAANPGGGTGINLTASATGVNLYACNRTGNPNCTPTLQTNGTNPNGVLAQPVITSVTGCPAGSSSHSFQLVARNAGGTSIPSLPVTVSGMHANLVSFGGNTCKTNFSLITNATAYDALIDSDTTRTATGSTSPLTLTNSFLPYVVQTTPIGTTPTITAINTTGSAAPTVNTAGTPIHNFRMDKTGQFITMRTANAFGIDQNAPPKVPFGFIWQIAANKLIPCGPYQQTAPYLAYCVSHWTDGPGTMYTQLGGVLFGEAAETTFNSDVNVMNNTQRFLNTVNAGLGPTETGHLSGNFTGFVTFDNYVSDGPAAKNYPLPTGLYGGELGGWRVSDGTAFRFCHNWTASSIGFNATPRGNESQDGTVDLFVSDFQRNGLGLQGTSSVGFGCLDGTNSGCTLGNGGNVRTDLLLCTQK